MIAELRRFAAAVWTHPVARTEPLSACYRLARWQVRRRLTGQPLAVDAVNGGRLLVFPGRAASTAAYYFRLPDFDELLFLLHLLRPGDRFLDGGANVGVWSVLAATTGATAVAVEPAPDTFALLEQQAAGQGGRVRPVRCALAAAAGTVRLSAGRDAGNQVVAAGGVEVPARTVDDVAAEAGGPPTAVKLDLEGYELDALHGAAATLAAPELLALVIETFRPYNWQTPQLRAIEAVLATAGFRPFGYRPADRTLVPLAGLDTPPADSGQNTIYVRDPAAVADRLRAAAPVRVGRLAW